MSRSDGRRGRARAGQNAVRPAVLLLFSLAALAAVFGATADGAMPSLQPGSVPPVPPIPDAGFAPGWAKAGPLRTFTGQDLFNQIDGGAELFLEFGFARLRLQGYVRGQAELTLNAYEMESAASALGVYLMKMGKETPFPGLEARNSCEEIQLTMLKGRYFVQVDNLGEVPAATTEAVALANAFLAGVARESGPTPLDALPAEGKVPGTERLVRGPYGLQPYFTFGEGDILSQGGRIFGALASYRTPEGATFTRLIVPYPDSPSAAAAFAHLKAGLDPYLKVTSERPEGFDFVDYQGKKGRVARSGAVLEILFNLPSAAPAPSLRPVPGSK